MKKFFFGIATAVAAVTMAGAAIAGTQSGRVTSIHVRHNDGLIYFTLEGTISNRAACAANDLWIVQAENSDNANKQLAALLAARASDLPVTVSGNGQCTRWVNSEDADEIIF
ncbi:hypothetical protein KPL74_10400 [Bacillus sp. NP157]|nr:hypothetical protein KPL74_10400 [Bacillus sp. NP157]